MKPWSVIGVNPSKRKSGLKYGLSLGAFVATIVGSVPLFESLAASADSTVELGFVAAFVVWLSLVWLYGIQAVADVVFAYVPRADVPKGDYADYEDEAVALLYPTFNDFSPTHIDRARDLNHDRVTTYVLDDSSAEEKRAEIDAYADERDDVVVVRRDDRTGFKGGAINHALETVADEEYFAVTDADEVLPDDFVEKLIPHFDDETVGWVQGNHDYNKDTASRFGDAVGYSIDVAWNTYLPQKNRYGFVLLLGHGAMVRRETWETIGGFPEVVSEDLAFAARARDAGYHGVFVTDVDCREDAPVEFGAFRTRNKKWSAGQLAVISTVLPELLRSDATLTEKIDVLLPITALPVRNVLFTLPALFGLFWTFNAPPTAPVETAILPGAVTATVLAAPVVPYLTELLPARKARAVVRYWTTIPIVDAATAVAGLGYTLVSLVGGAEFLTTPKTESDGIQFRQYFGTMAVGALALAGAPLVQSRLLTLLVGLLGLAWLFSPLLEAYNEQSALGTVARGLPYAIWLWAAGYAAFAF